MRFDRKVANRTLCPAVSPLSDGQKRSEVTFEVTFAKNTCYLPSPKPRKKRPLATKWRKIRRFLSNAKLNAAMNRVLRRNGNVSKKTLSGAINFVQPLIRWNKVTNKTNFANFWVEKLWAFTKAEQLVVHPHLWTEPVDAPPSRPRNLWSRLGIVGVDQGRGVWSLFISPIETNGINDRDSSGNSGSALKRGENCLTVGGKWSLPVPRVLIDANKRDERPLLNRMISIIYKLYCIL